MRNHRESCEPLEQDQSPDECIGACFTKHSSTQTHVPHVSQSDALKTRSHALPGAEFAQSRNFKFGIIDQKSLDSSIKVTKSAQTMASISTDLLDIKTVSEDWKCARNTVFIWRWPWIKVAGLKARGLCWHRDIVDTSSPANRIPVGFLIFRYSWQVMPMLNNMVYCINVMIIALYPCGRKLPTQTSKHHGLHPRFAPCWSAVKTNRAHRPWTCKHPKNVTSKMPRIIPISVQWIQFTRFYT